jgi:predicted MFS family arabinose efflux permease
MNWTEIAGIAGIFLCAVSIALVVVVVLLDVVPPPSKERARKKREAEEAAVEALRKSKEKR